MTDKSKLPAELITTLRFTRTLSRLGVPLYCLFVTYCALVPFREWVIPQHDIIKVLFHDWIYKVYTFDVIQNVLLYLPLGFFVVFSYQHKRWFSSMFWAFILALCVSGLLEFLQSFNPVRVPSALDMLLNGLGGWIGAMFALMFYQGWLRAFHTMGTQILQPISLQKPLPLICFMMILGWGAYQWYPFLPTLQPDYVKDGYRLFWNTLQNPESIDLDHTLSYFSQGLILYALSMLSLRKNHFIFLLSYVAMILPFKILIIGRLLSLEAVVGCLTALIFARLVQVIIEKLVPKNLPQSKTNLAENEPN